MYQALRWINTWGGFYVLFFACVALQHKKTRHKNICFWLCNIKYIYKYNREQVNDLLKLLTLLNNNLVSIILIIDQLYAYMIIDLCFLCTRINTCNFKKKVDFLEHPFYKSLKMLWILKNEKSRLILGDPKMMKNGEKWGK